MQNSRIKIEVDVPLLKYRGFEVVEFESKIILQSIFFSNEENIYITLLVLFIHLFVGTFSTRIRQRCSYNKGSLEKVAVIIKRIFFGVRLSSLLFITGCNFFKIYFIFKFFLYFVISS